MSDYVIAFDISTKKMKDDGKEASITKTYSDFGKLLRSFDFDDKIQHSTYKTNNNDGLNCFLKLMRRVDQLTKQDNVPLFCKYAERVHILRCEEHSDITDRFRFNDYEDII
jgi:virulence-associated protein VapD